MPGARSGLLILGAAAGALAVAGCAALQPLTEVGTAVAVAAREITPEQARSINRSAAAVGKTFESITPEQEYYVGRTVAATLLSTRPVWKNRAATDYLNLMLQTLALASGRPETFGGYHLLVLDSDTINAFAAPGGFVLVTRGMLRCCRREDEVAAVLAHEIGHVAEQHGLQSINRSRITSALTILAAESAKTFGGRDVAELARAFEGSVADVTSTLVTSGYSRHFEEEADQEAFRTLRRAGYDPAALVAMLEEMARRLKPGGLDFARTHPDPGVRIGKLRPLLSDAPSAAAPQKRQARFERALQSL
jgi:predicted Zn-dependent protease